MTSLVSLLFITMIVRLQNSYNCIHYFVPHCIIARILNCSSAGMYIRNEITTMATKITLQTIIQST